MKEVRFFYVPDAASQTELPADEATHALRVLRLHEFFLYIKHFISSKYLAG